VRSSSEDIVSLYDRHASAWTRARDSHQFIEAEWMRRFEALLPESGAILDIGCGSGRPLAEHFIRRGFEVVGVDSSPTLISTCRSRFPEQSWFVSDMRELSLRCKFQGLIAWDSFFHLTHEHQRGMFAIFQKHAAAGAPLIFTSGTRLHEAIGSFEGEPLYHASLDPEEYRELLRAHGFCVVSHVVEDPKCGEHTVWLAQAVDGGIEINAGAV
jgi:SAM-dependent methyltransferase